MVNVALRQSARGRNRKALTRLTDWSYIILAMHNPVWATASVDQLVERLSRAILVPMWQSMEIIDFINSDAMGQGLGQSEWRHNVMPKRDSNAAPGTVQSAYFLRKHLHGLKCRAENYINNQHGRKKNSWLLTLI